MLSFSRQSDSLLPLELLPFYLVTAPSTPLEVAGGLAFGGQLGMNIRVCVPAQVGVKTVEEAAAHDGENCIYYAVPITAVCCLKFWKLPGQVTQDLLEGVLMVVTTKKPEMKCEC